MFQTTVYHCADIQLSLRTSCPNSSQATNCLGRPILSTSCYAHRDLICQESKQNDELNCNRDSIPSACAQPMDISNSVDEDEMTTGPAHASCCRTLNRDWRRRMVNKHNGLEKLSCRVHTSRT